jgi:hypothetical protein
MEDESGSAVGKGGACMGVEVGKNPMIVRIDEHKTEDTGAGTSPFMTERFGWMTTVLLWPHTGTALIWPALTPLAQRLPCMPFLQVGSINLGSTQQVSVTLLLEMIYTMTKPQNARWIAVRA